MKQKCFILNKEKDLRYFDINQDLEQVIQNYISKKYGGDYKYVSYIDNGDNCSVFVEVETDE